MGISVSDRFQGYFFLIFTCISLYFGQL
jgi:hypothetical protein